MAKVKIQLWKYRANKDGTHPLFVRIYKNGKTKLISTEYSIKESDWDTKKGIVKSTHKNSVRLNSLLSKLVSEAQAGAIEAENQDFDQTARQIVAKIRGNSNADYFEFAYAYIEQFNNIPQYGTYKTYKSKLRKLKNYLKGQTITFNDIDVTFLRQYETYLKKLGNKVNSIHGDLKRIRSIYYAAIREGVADQKRNPFFNFKLKSEKTHKERLTAEELDAIRELDLEEGSLIWHCRNEFLLSFNFMGMRVKDVLLLKYSHINRGQLQYQMHKSKDLVSISLSEEALEIIGWYEKRKKTDAIYILPFFTDRKNEPLAKELESATALINKYLKKIAKMASINKKVSTHVARHSWAQAVYFTLI